MNETVYVYIVHSDINENNIYAEFETEEEAIEYARRNKDELTYVDRVEVALDEDGDIIEEFDSETIWVYDEEAEDLVEEDDFFSFKDEEVECQNCGSLVTSDRCIKTDGGDYVCKDCVEEDFDTLVETLEENEDIVECKECFDLFPKEACTKVAIGYICPECGKIHSHEEPEFEIDSIPDVVVADDDFFKVDFPELERTDYGNDMIPDEPSSEVEPNPEPMAEPCVGPECEAPIEAPVTKDETITKLVIDEHEAIDGYEQAKIEIEANSELDEKEKEEILDTIEHIKEEEIEHIEELEELVDEVEETKAEEPAEESESEDESEVLVEETANPVVEEPKEEVPTTATPTAQTPTETPTEKVAEEEKDLDAELAKKKKQLKIAKVDAKIAKQQAKQAKHLKVATKQTNTAAKDSAKTNLTVNKKNNAVTKDTAKTDLAVTKAANDIEVDNSKTKVAVSKDDVKVAKNTLKTTKLNNKIKAITPDEPEEEIEEILPTEVEQPVETPEVEPIEEALLEGFLTDLLADAGAGAGIGAIGGTTGAVVGAGAGALFAIVKNISKSIGDSFKQFKDANDVKKALKRDPQLNDTIEKLVAETGEDNAEKILQWIEDYYTRKVFEEKPTAEPETEITELDVVDDFEDEFEGLEDILEESLNTNILTEANWGGFIGIGAASVEDKLDAFFSTEGGKEGKFKYNKNYGSNFELKEYSAKTKEFKDLSEADAKYINLIDNEYEQVRTAKKDAEKLSKSDGAKDKYIAVCIREYKETDTPSIYIYQNGKLKVDHSETKIKYFEAKYDGVKGNSNNSTQNDLEEANYAFTPAEVTFELANLQEKEISVLKGTNNISDEKLIKTFKFGFTKGIPTNIFTFSRISLNKYKLTLNKEELDKITDESTKEKLFATEGIKLRLTIEGKTEAICTIIIKKATPTEVPAEEPVVHQPTHEQLRSAYRLLVALLGTKDKAAEYITVEGKGINAKYNLVQGKTLDDIKAKIKELQKAVLGESLTEHVNEEHPAIESDQKLVGIDNAVVDCKVNKVITHSEDEKPVDCKGDKKPLEKPLTEELGEDKLQVMEDYLKSTKFASLDTEWEDEGDFYVDIIGAYLDYTPRTNMFTLGLSIYHASEDNNAEYPERHTDEEEFSYDSLAEMYEDEECREILDRLYEDNLAKLDKSLSEATHAQVAKPEGSRTLAYNNALKYAKKANKPFIYGYTNHTGKFFAAEIPMKVTGSPADAEKEFRRRYKNCSVIYVVYPDKEFITESFVESIEDDLNKAYDDVIIAENELKEIEREIRNLRSAKRAELDTVAEYSELRKRLIAVQKELSDLRATYERWEIVNDEWDHDLVVFDREKEKELEPKINELESIHWDLWHQVKAFEKEVEDQISNDTDLKLKDKQNLVSTAKALRQTTFEKYLESEKQNILNAFNYINIEDNCRLNLKGATFNKQANTVFIPVESSYTKDLYWNDWDDDGSFNYSEDEEGAKDFIDDSLMDPDAIADYLELTKDEEGNYIIPDSNWKLLSEADWEFESYPTSEKYDDEATAWLTCYLVKQIKPSSNSVVENFRFTKAEQEEYNMDEEGYSLDSHDQYIRCGWCEDICTKYDCKYEKNLGWLCPNCRAAIESRGEPAVYVEGPIEEDLVEAVKTPNSIMNLDISVFESGEAAMYVARKITYDLVTDPQEADKLWAWGENWELIDNEPKILADLIKDALVGGNYHEEAEEWGWDELPVQWSWKISANEKAQMDEYIKACSATEDKFKLLFTAINYLSLEYADNWYR